MPRKLTQCCRATGSGWLRAAGSALARGGNGQATRQWPVSIEWSPTAARASAHRGMNDQDGMHAIGAAVRASTIDPNPSDGFIGGGYRRLRVDAHRATYVVGGWGGDIITIERVGLAFLGHAAKLGMFVRVDHLRLRYGSTGGGRGPVRGDAGGGAAASG